MKQTNDYTSEQVSNAEEFCELFNSIPKDKRGFVGIFMMAYMNGIESGMMYAQEIKTAQTT